MLKRFLILTCLFFIGLIIPFGCANSDTNTSNNKVLNIYNWETYIAPEVLSEFEQKFNVKIKYDTFDSVETLYAKLKQGNPGYDLIFPADYMVKRMIAESIIQPINLDNIPNKINLDPKFANPPYDPGNKYSLPYQWGTVGIGYNIKNTKEEITTWKQLFEPKFKGKVSLIDDMRNILGMALIYEGYDPNTKNVEEINKARDLLIKNKDIVAAFAADDGQKLLAQGQVDLAVEWSGDIFQVMKENPDLRYVIPKEGSTIYTDNMAIPVKAPHKELAEKFINFILDAKVGAQVSNFTNYGSPNKASKDQGLINPQDLQNPAIYPPAALFNKLKYIEDLGEVTTQFDRAWMEVKSAVSK